VSRSPTALTASCASPSSDGQTVVCCRRVEPLSPLRPTRPQAGDLALPPAPLRLHPSAGTAASSNVQTPSASTRVVVCASTAPAASPIADPGEPLTSGCSRAKPEPRGRAATAQRNRGCRCGNDWSGACNSLEPGFDIWRSRRPVSSRPARPAPPAALRRRRLPQAVEPAAARCLLSLTVESAATVITCAGYSVQSVALPAAARHITVDGPEQGPVGRRPRD